MSNYQIRRLRRLRALAKLARMKRKGISYQIEKTIYHKQHRYALKALEPAWIPVRQIEAGGSAIKRFAGRWEKIWVLPYRIPIISNTETRIDYSEKGDPMYIIRTYKVCLIQPGDVLYQISNSILSETLALRALALAAYRMPIKTQTDFIYVISKN